MSRYLAERGPYGVWQVRDTHGDGVVVYGPGAAGAAAARAGAERLNRPRPGGEIRAWRTAHGLSQGALAKLLGVQWLAVQRWEAGDRQPPPYLHLALRALEADV